MTPVEFDRLLAALPGDRWWVWAETAIKTGLRWGELVELRAADVDWNRNTVAIARTVIELRSSFHPTGGHFLVKGYTKNHEHRTLRLSTRLVTLLRTHITDLRLGPGDLLFSRSPAIRDDTDAHPSDGTAPTTFTEASVGRRYRHGKLSGYSLGPCRCPRCRAAYANYRAARRAVGKDRPPIPHRTRPDPHLPRDWFRKAIWQPALAAAGITRRVRVRDLRHANASWMLASGADIQTVRERLGHASLRAAEYYLHSLPNTDHTTLHALDAIRHHCTDSTAA